MILLSVNKKNNIYYVLEFAFLINYSAKSIYIAKHIEQMYHICM